MLSAVQEAKKRLREKVELDTLDDADLDMASVLAGATQMQSDLVWAHNILYAVAEYYDLHPGLYDQVMAFLEHSEKEY